MEVIESAGVLYTINKKKYESRELYLMRCWFIINNLNKYTFNELIYLSQIWINIKYFKMEYPIHITNMVKKCNDQSEIFS